MSANLVKKIEPKASVKHSIHVDAACMIEFTQNKCILIILFSPLMFQRKRPDYKCCLCCWLESYPTPVNVFWNQGLNFDVKYQHRKTCKMICLTTFLNSNV